MSAADTEKRALAVTHLSKAWAAAAAEGVPADVMAGVALAKAYSELVDALGAETAANIAARFPDEIRSGRLGSPHGR